LSLQNIINCKSLPQALKKSLQEIAEINPNHYQQENVIPNSSIRKACQILKKQIQSDLFVGSNSLSKNLSKQIEKFEYCYVDKMAWYTYWLDQTKILFENYKSQNVKLWNCELIYPTFLHYIQMFLTIMPLEKRIG
jgi:hypothetical protein